MDNVVLHFEYKMEDCIFSTVIKQRSISGYSHPVLFLSVILIDLNHSAGICAINFFGRYADNLGAAPVF